MREFANVVRVDLRDLGAYLGAVCVVLLALGGLGWAGVVTSGTITTGTVVVAIMFDHAIFASRRPGYPLGVFELLPVRPRTVLLAHYSVAVVFFLVAVAISIGSLVAFKGLGLVLEDSWVDALAGMSGFGLLALGVTLAFHSSRSSGRAVLRVWGPVGVLTLGLLFSGAFLDWWWGVGGLPVAGVLGIIVSFLFSLPFVEKEAR